jgi:nitronate monooxygenase
MKMGFTLNNLEHPIVAAPMAGGPSTPELAAAVSGAGGLGFLAQGYKSVDAARDDIRALRERTDRPFGVGIFAPPEPVPDQHAVDAYARELGDGAGAPRHDDDSYADKLALAIEERVPVVSFTFGCPDAETIGRLRDAGIAVWITTTTAAEARDAAAAGADALVVQGYEAGGHRGTWADAAPGDVGLLALLQITRAVTDVPMVATGGIATGAGIAAVLVAGAAAAQLGSAFMLAAEAGTSPAYRERLTGDGPPTALTRAFTGRSGRGIPNRFMAEHDDGAPLGYPDVHHATSPLRAVARKAGDADGFNLWAGQAHALAQAKPAGELVRALAAGARSALRAAQ